MPKYLVGNSESPFEEQDFCLVTADNKGDAERQYLSAKAIHDEMFLEYVQSRSVNNSFAEKFWFQTEEEERRLFSDGDVIVSGDEFKRRVRRFFADDPAYGELYLKHWYDDDQQFPDEMLAVILQHTSWIHIAVVALDAVEEV